jgi:anti-sigma factor RsiW
MSTNHPSDEFQAALTRVIEGESEPADDLLVAAALRSDPECREQFINQLQMDALLWLEAEPTASASVDSVADRIRAPEANAGNDADFVRRVVEALPRKPKGLWRSGVGSWLAWRPLTAAAAGVVFGTLFTSVLSAYVAPKVVKGMTVFADGFEASPSPQAVGVPAEFGVWGGDFSEVAGPQNGVAPHGGARMWRFLRADNVGKTDAKASYVGEAIRVLDLKGVRSAGFLPGSQIEVSAWFAQGHTTGAARYHWNIKAAVFEGGVAGAPALWEGWDQASASMARRDVAAGPSGAWERLSVTLVLPPHADFLTFECAVVQRHPRITEGVAEFPAHYVDDVRVRILPPVQDNLSIK